jgi:hypothetical protein
MRIAGKRFFFRHSDEDVRNDFLALAKVEWEDTLFHESRQWILRTPGIAPKKGPIFRTLFTGQLLSERFHWPHRVRTATIHHASGETVLRRWAEQPKLLSRTRERFSKRKSMGNDRETLDFRTVQMNSALLTLTHFRATVSKCLCDREEAESVLDFSAGWGDRLTGFLASPSVRSITLVDPRHGSISACRKQFEFVKRITPGVSKTLRTHQKGAEDVLRTLASKSVDLIVTSPPYFDLELYGEEENDAKGQIGKAVSSNQEYLKHFLLPVVDQCARLLRPGGLLALNVDDNPKAGVFLCKPLLSHVASHPSLSLESTWGLRKGRGFGKGVEQDGSGTRVEPVYMIRKAVS